MAYPHTRKQFDLTAPFYAVRSFVFDGARSLEVGDLFDVSGLRTDTISMLWSQRYIDHEQVAVRTAPAVTAAPSASTPAQPAHEPQARHKRREGARP